MTAKRPNHEDNQYKAVGSPQDSLKAIAPPDSKKPPEGGSLGSESTPAKADTPSIPDELDEILTSLVRKTYRNRDIDADARKHLEKENIAAAKAALLAWHHSALLREVKSLLPLSDSGKLDALMHQARKEGYEQAIKDVDRQQLLGRYGEGAK